MSNESSQKRVITSRKLWGGVIASGSIITAGRIINDPGVAIQAIMQLGFIWLAIVGGQAVADSIKERQKKNNQDGNQ